MQEPMDNELEARDIVSFVERQHQTKRELGVDYYLYRVSLNKGRSWRLIEMSMGCAIELEELINRQPDTWVCDNGVTHDSYCNCNPTELDEESRMRDVKAQGDDAEENYLVDW